MYQGEIGDICEGINGTVETDIGYRTVQSLYSQIEQKCIVSKNFTLTANVTSIISTKSGNMVYILLEVIQLGNSTQNVNLTSIQQPLVINPPSFSVNPVLGQGNTTVIINTTLIKSPKPKTVSLVIQGKGTVYTRNITISITYQ